MSFSKLSDKDRSYLEERIKRAGKVKAPPAAESKQAKAAKKPPAAEVKDQVDADVVVVTKMKPRNANAR